MSENNQDIKKPQKVIKKVIRKEISSLKITKSKPINTITVKSIAVEPVSTKTEE